MKTLAFLALAAVAFVAVVAEADAKVQDGAPGSESSTTHTESLHHSQENEFRMPRKASFYDHPHDRLTLQDAVLSENTKTLHRIRRHFAFRPLFASRQRALDNQRRFR